MGANIKTFKEKEVIFGEGSYADEMYEICSGTVGIFKDYGKDTQVKLAELTDGYFGEMGLISKEARSATAVALEETTVMPISLETMEGYYSGNAEKVEVLMQTISSRLRTMDIEYMKACECLDACREAEESGSPVPAEVLEVMKQLTKSM